jgi:hypothetical protein
VVFDESKLEDLQFDDSDVTEEILMPCPKCGKPAHLEGVEELGARWYVCMDDHKFRVTADE